jgi:NADH-quinone oxidoreductase subunit L
MLFGDYFKGVIHVAEPHEAMADLRHHFHGATAMAIHASTTSTTTSASMAFRCPSSS